MDCNTALTRFVFGLNLALSNLVQCGWIAIVALAAVLSI